MSKLSLEEEKIMIKDWNDGVTKKDIAQKFGVAEKTIKVILERNGIFANRLIKYDKKSKEKAQEMALNGASDVEISAETGISLNLASQYVKRVEKEIEQIAEDSLLIRAIPLEKIRYIVINGTNYTDITDFVAGI